MNQANCSTGRFVLPMLVYGATLSLLGRAALGQEGTGRATEAYQASVAQDGLRRDAAAVQAELTELREQIRQLSPDDLPVIDRAIKQLDTLSRDEMERVVQALRGASRPDAPGQASSQALVNVLKDQGAISVALKHLAVALDARQSMEGIEAQLGALLLRQVSVRNEIVRLGRVQQFPAQLHDQHHDRQAAAQQDQASLSEDVKILAQSITNLSQTLEGEAQQAYLGAAAALRDGKIDEALAQATTLTSQGPFDHAAAVQQNVIGTLVKVEQALAGNRPMSERLNALSARVKSTLEAQQAVLTTVLAIGERTSVKDETRRTQGMLADQAGVLHYELEALNARASAELQAADDFADKALLNFVRMWEERLSAQDNERQEVACLTRAEQALETQIAALPAQTPATVADLAAALDALRRDTAQVAATEKRAAQAASANPAANTPADQAVRKALEDQIAALQERAVPIAPAAAAALSDAAQAAQNPDAAAQTAVAQDLAKAADALAQQENELTGRSPAEQALAAATTDAQQAAQALAQVQPELGSTQTSGEAVNQLNAVKQDAAAALQAAAKAGAPPEALSALAQANTDINQAQQDAAQTNLAQAQADAKNAQQALAGAQQALAKAGQAMAAKAAGPAMAAKAGNDAGQRQTQAGTPQGKGNGGGGSSGDNLAGAGAKGVPIAPVDTLTPQQRDAVAQLQKEQPPAEFAPDVQQYYKNIADGAGLWK